MAHNIHLVEAAKKIDRTWNPYWGVFDRRGNCFASAREEEIFRALKMDYVEPEQRET